MAIFRLFSIRSRSVNTYFSILMFLSCSTCAGFVSPAGPQFDLSIADISFYLYCILVIPVHTHSLCAAPQKRTRAKVILLRRSARLKRKKARQPSALIVCMHMMTPYPACAQGRSRMLVRDHSQGQGEYSRQLPNNRAAAYGGLPLWTTVCVIPQLS